MKSTLQIFMEEWDKVFTPKAIKELRDAMNKINPSRICANCNNNCGNNHMLCAQCYYDFQFGKKL